MCRCNHKYISQVHQYWANAPLKSITFMSKRVQKVPKGYVLSLKTWLQHKIYNIIFYTFHIINNSQTVKEKNI